MKQNGIAFTGGNTPPPAFSRELCQKASLEGGIYVVAADSGLIAAEEAGIAPDLIVGDMDSLNDLSRLQRYPAQKVRRFPPDKDLLDTEIALNALWEAGCTTVTLIGGGGGRLDHLLALRALFDRPRCPRRWVGDTEDIQIIENGTKNTVNLHLPAGTRISVLPAGLGPWAVDSAGLTWPLSGLQIDIGWTGISNTARCSEVSITALEGRFLVLTPLISESFEGTRRFLV
jgi:thiamine pyrophosphokinase